ncbi:MAG: O-antigen ligase domain-containing protein, partial [Lentisphaerae bacterium]
MPWRVVLHWSLLLPVAMICTISLRRDPRFESMLCTVLAISIACLSFQVLFEYFITTPALISEYTEKIKQHPDAPDIRFWKEIVMRLRQQRPQANFSITNLLAGYYILVIPFLCAWIWKLARHVEPARISPWILTPLVGGLLFFCLYVTQSRAAILSLFLAACAGLFFCLVLRFGELGRQEDRQGKRLLIRQLTFMMITMFCLVIMMVALYSAVAGNRTLSSLWARFDYWSIAWKTFIHAPLTGTGHGGFFPAYLQFRSPEMEIARLPHSLFYNLIASCGISGCLWFIVWAWVIFKTYATTLQAWLIEKRLPFFYPAVATGCVAWFLH